MVEAIWRTRFSGWDTPKRITLLPGYTNAHPLRTQIMMQIEYIDRATGQLIQENPPGASFLRFLYHQPFDELSLEMLVKRKAITALYGRLMDRPASRKRIQAFVDTFQINMDESVKSVSEFTSFNDFFYRRLKPTARPIQDGLVSPADGKLLAFENVAALNEFFVKGNRFTLEAFLKDAALARQYENAALVIVRLAPHDYHRFHFPCAGTPAASKDIPGFYYSVSPYAVSVNFARVFCENKRSYTILKSEQYGDVLLSPVGATMVGSILHTYAADRPIDKGHEMGYFAFGGSSVLMLLPEGNTTLDADLLAHTQKGRETAVRMGERIGG